MLHRVYYAAGWQRCAHSVNSRKRGWLRTNPTANIKPRAIKGDGFHILTNDEIAQFEAHHPIGSKPRLAPALLLYTAQRRSDVIRMGRQHIRDGVLSRIVLDATPSAKMETHRLRRFVIRTRKQEQFREVSVGGNERAEYQPWRDIFIPSSVAFV